MGLLTDLKHEILRLLKEDEEFRYAVAGLIGLGEVLKRLDRHEEELKRLREDLARLREDFLVFVKEQEKRWEENNRRWEEASRRFEAIENELKKLREDFNRFVEIEEKRWEENNRRWEENNRRWEETNRRFSRIELELGVLTESTYSRYIWEDLREEIRARGEVILARRRNAVVDGAEVDLLIETDRHVYVIEVKIKPSVGDVGSLIAKAEVVEKKLGKPVIPILVGALIGDDVRVYAESKGATVYSY